MNDWPAILAHSTAPINAFDSVCVLSVDWVASVIEAVGDVCVVMVTVLEVAVSVEVVVSVQISPKYPGKQLHSKPLAAAAEFVQEPPFWHGLSNSHGSGEVAVDAVVVVVNV
jgi:hypothetical protein